jgi:PadR family transcriptional regulator, regulatory protein PadR
LDIDISVYLFYFAVIMNGTASIGEFEQIVLLAILRLGDSAYGVSIGNEIESCARRKTTPGALYTTLNRLEQKGLLMARCGEPTLARGGRAKRFYQLTKDGRSRLVDAQEAFHRLLVGLNLIGETHG